jgi:hypothetical protein
MVDTARRARRGRALRRGVLLVIAATAVWLVPEERQLDRIIRFLRQRPIPHGAP